MKRPMLIDFKSELDQREFTQQETEPIQIVWTDEEAPKPIDYTWSGFELVPIYLMEAATPNDEAAATS